jgi:outer membrane protein OmpU
MNNLKKIGLSALAGTLASLSAAQAGEMAVSGSAELSYVQRDNDEITGNPIGMNKNISFSGSGELDNGWTVGVMHAMSDAMGHSSSSLSIGMGALGTLAVDSGTGGYGLSAMDNVVPIAFEEADAGFSTGMVDAGGVVGTQNAVFWKAPELVPGLALTAGYSPRGGSSAQADGATSGDVGGGLAGWELSGTWSPEMLPGLKVGAGLGERENGSNGSNNQDLEEETYFATYTFGPLSVGYQVTGEENGGSTNYDTDVYGASFLVNDVFSISYQYGETEYKPTTGASVTAEFTGISAAYNIGPMAIKFTDNTARDYNGTAGSDDDNRELNLSMAF